MNFIDDIITYVRRIIKSPSDSEITTALILDYFNRFVISDVQARLQMFDFKTKYQFVTQPGVDKYNMPLYTVQSETAGQPNNPDIGMYPVYQGFLPTVFVNGIEVYFQTQKNQFSTNYPAITQNFGTIVVSDGRNPPIYQLQVPFINNPLPPLPINPPLQAIIRGHVDITGIIATGLNVDPPIADTSTFAGILGQIPTTSIDSAVFITTTDQLGNNVIVADSGIMLNQINYGCLMTPGKAPFGNTQLPGGYSTNSNTINYLSGEINVQFPVVIPAGVNISVQCQYYQTGLPRMMLWYNNVMTFRSNPDRQYVVELDAYLTPCAYFSTQQTLPFAYMAEYLARGTARKILSDTGDVDQFMFYEPLFKEQEMLVWKRSQRQFTSTRTETIYSQGNGQNGNYSGYGGLTY